MCSRLFLFTILLLCVYNIEAHVRIRYTGYSIRNANGPTADGAYSTGKTIIFSFILVFVYLYYMVFYCIG